MEIKIESELLELLVTMLLIQVCALACRVINLRRKSEFHKVMVEVMMALEKYRIALTENTEKAFENLEILTKKHNDLINTLNHVFNKNKNKNGDSPINNNPNLN